MHVLRNFGQLVMRQRAGLFFFRLLPLLVALLPALNISSAKAQQGPDFYEAEAHVGYIVKNYPVYPDLPGPVYMGSLHIGKRLSGNRIWHRYYRYPFLGAELIMAALPNRKVLGNIIGLAPEMFFMQQLSNRVYVGENLAMGLGWYSRPYDKNDNPSNTLVGSRLTAFPHAGIGVEYYITPYWSVWLRASVHHGSNCHYQLPNLGVNVPSASIAVRYHPHPALIASRDQTPFETDKKVHFNIRLGVGVNERGKSTGPTGGPKHMIYLTQFYLTRNFAPVNKVQAGFEFGFNSGVHDTIHHGGFFRDKQTLRSSSAVFFLGHEFLMGHASLSVQGGIFIYNPYYRELARREKVRDVKEQLKTLFIARLGFQYYFKDIVLVHKNQLYAGIYVKTNFGQADFLDLGLGYTF